jgi:hypothetical protein
MRLEQLDLEVLRENQPKKISPGKRRHGRRRSAAG